MNSRSEPIPEELAVRFDDVHVLFSKWFGPPVLALRGFHLDVPKGAVMGLLGPNGAGKTTSLMCLLSLLRPAAGDVYMWGRRVSNVNPQPRPGCGALLEDTRLPPFLAVRDALGAVCALRRVRSPAKELDRVISLCGIRDLLTRTVSVLSKGQARKAGLAAALIGDLPLLVLDEPSAGLDAEARVEFERLVLELHDGRRTMLMASHLLGDVEATCTHVAVVQEGRVVLTGRIDELLREARRDGGSDVYIEASSTAALIRPASGTSRRATPGSCSFGRSSRTKSSSPR